MNCNLHELQFTKCNLKNYKSQTVCFELINCNWPIFPSFFNCYTFSSSFSSSCGPRKRRFPSFSSMPSPHRPLSVQLAVLPILHASRPDAAILVSNLLRTVTSLDLPHAQKCDCNMPPFSNPMSTVLSSTN